MHLFLVRHGQCETAVDGALTPEGEARAQQVAHRLAGEQITHILSSPLLRALGTASCIAEACDQPIQVWTDLREGFDHIHQGLGREHLLRRFPRATLPDDMTAEGWSHGGDTYPSFFARSQYVLERLQACFVASDRVVLVAHGGLINYLMHAILGISSATPCWFDLDYCAMTHVYLIPQAEQWNWPLYPPMAAEILCVNDVSHLNSQGR